MSFASVVEMFVVGLLVRIKHPTAANLLLVLSAVGAIWLLGFARAVQLRPIFVTNETLHLRMGLRWTIDVPRSSIESLNVGRTKIPSKSSPNYLRLIPQPNVLLTL